MKRLLAMAIVLCTARAAAGWPASPPQTPHPAVVRIMAPERNGASFGSGTLVAVSDTHGLVLTNWHVVRDAAGPIIVSFPDGFQSGAVLLKTDRTWDLAALAVWRPKVQPVALSTTVPQPGEPLAIAGYGKGSYRMAAGKCTQYVSPGENNPFDMLEVSTSAREGDSGGPILNGRGELAGVLFGSGFGHTAGSHCNRVRWFLASVSDQFQRLPANPSLIAQQPPPREPAPIAAIGGVRAVRPPDGFAPGGAVAAADRPMAPGVAAAPASATAMAKLPPTSGAPPAQAEPVGGQPAVTVSLLPGQLAQAGQPPLAAGTQPPGEQTVAPTVSPVPLAPTFLDQIKTGLAVIGALSLLFHGLRLFSCLET